MLLKNGAAADIIDNTEKSAILYAAANGSIKIVNLLIDYGVDVNKQYKNDLTPLMWAAGYGHLDVVKMLVNHGAKLNVKDNRGYNALTIAKRNDHQ